MNTKYGSSFYLPEHLGIWFQAHQSSTTEVPENTMAAMRYAWSLGGIPEIDIRQTKDGVIVGLHDQTIRRTIQAPENVLDKNINEFTFLQTQNWDAGIKFSDATAGEKVPALENVIEVMLEDSSRNLYLDFKDVDLNNLADLVHKYGAANKIIFAHNNHDNCRAIKKLVPQIRTMLWISGGGSPQGVLETFNKAKNSGFDCLDIVQVHIHRRQNSSNPNENQEQIDWPYLETLQFLAQRLQETAQANVEMEILLCGTLHENALTGLFNIGVRRFAVDEPKRFVKIALDKLA